MNTTLLHKIGNILFIATICHQHIIEDDMAKQIKKLEYENNENHIYKKFVVDTNLIQPFDTYKKAKEAECNCYAHYPPW